MLMLDRNRMRTNEATRAARLLGDVYRFGQWRSYTQILTGIELACEAAPSGDTPRLGQARPECLAAPGNCTDHALIL